VGINWNASTKENIAHIKEKVSSGKFPQLLKEYKGNEDVLSIQEDLLYSLATLADETEENVKMFPVLVPFHCDVATMSKFQRMLDALGVEYGKRDYMVAFKTVDELNDAIVRVWLADWEKNLILEDYMIEKDLFGLTCPSHIRGRLEAILGGSSCSYIK